MRFSASHSHHLKWAALSALLFALCFSVSAQQAGKIPRLGYLDTSTASASAVRLEAFWQELRNLGWIQGKNIAVEYRFQEQDNKGMPDLAADLIRLKVDLIVVVGTRAAVAAKSATSTIPIVMTGVGDPVAAGLIASLARPEGNVTGVSALSPELDGKRLEILKDAIPRLSRVGLLFPSGGGIGRDLQLKELRVAAPALKLKLEEIETQLDAERFRGSLSNREAKTGGRDYYDSRAAHFRPKKTDRRACWQISVAGYLLPERVCR
jgi:putative ABC transport system substrate-binding protein